MTSGHFHRRSYVGTITGSQHSIEQFSKNLIAMCSCLQGLIHRGGKKVRASPPPTHHTHTKIPDSSLADASRFSEPWIRRGKGWVWSCPQWRALVVMLFKRVIAVNSGRLLVFTLHRLRWCLVVKVGATSLQQILLGNIFVEKMNNEFEQLFDQLNNALI